MKTAILAIGTELLFGQTINTNAAYLSKELNIMGFDVIYHYTVGDNPARMMETIDLAFKSCDIVITTGGLGPTQDDMTKDVICEYFGDKQVMHQSSMEHVKKMFIKMNRPMTENNIKQAYMPSEARVLPNSQGTAPGFAIKKTGKIAICLPGPPREMKKMFSEEVKPYLEAMSSNAICYKLIRTFGIGESQMETDLMDLIDGQTDPTIATYAKEGESYIRIASKRQTYEEAEAAVEDMIEKIRLKIGEYIYDYDNNDLADVVGKKLLDKNITISCAESITGGKFAARLTDIPGISKVFMRDFVTYNEKAKIDLLGVKEETLKRFTAVSAETAREMAEGVLSSGGSDISIAVTGIAGPEGGTPERPVGLVYISAIYKGRKITKEIRMRNVNRNWNRNYAMLHMFDIVNRLIDGRKIKGCV